MKKFSMMVGFCEDLTNYTMRTDCVPSSFVRENLNYLYVDSKILTNFFDFVHYNKPTTGAKNSLQTNRAFYRQPLDEHLITKKIWLIQQTSVTLYNNVFYNFQFLDGQKFETYTVNLQDTSIRYQDDNSSLKSIFLL